MWTSPVVPPPYVVRRTSTQSSPCSVATLKQSKQVKGTPVNRTTALATAGLLLMALPLAACTSSKPTETSPAPQGGGASAASSAAPTGVASSMAAPAKASKNYNLQFIQGVA